MCVPFCEDRITRVNTFVKGGVGMVTVTRYVFYL